MSNFKLLDEAFEVAKITRGMLLSGVHGSDKTIDVRNSDEGIPLARLLEYSHSTRKYSSALRSMLGSLRTNAVSGNGHDLYDIGSGVDLVYKMENGGPVYYFTPNVTHPHERYLYVDSISGSIQLRNSAGQATWMVNLYVIDGGLTSIYRIATSELYPEKNMLLNFWFSKFPMRGPDILKNLSLSATEKEYISFENAVMWKGFTLYQYLFKGDLLANVATLNRRMFGEYNAQAVTVLRRRANFRFSIVLLGTTEIGGLRHWVYTGSERVESLFG